MKTSLPLAQPQQPASQPCGECQACCQAVGVDDFPSGEDKPAGVKCQHQCESGCGIYSSRPESCRTYYCFYQAGMFGDAPELRPDKLGLIFDLRANSSDPEDSVVSAWELWGGAAQGPALPLLQELASRFIVAVRASENANKVRLLGPAHKLAQIQEVRIHS